MQFNDCHIGPGARHECGSRIAGDQLIRSVDENRANADEPGKDGLRDPYAAGIGPLQIVDDEAGAAPPRACGAPPPAAASGGLSGSGSTHLRSSSGSNCRPPASQMAKRGMPQNKSHEGRHRKGNGGSCPGPNHR